VDRPLRPRKKRQGQSGRSNRRDAGIAGLSTSADAQLGRAAVGDGATLTRSERSEQFSRAPSQDHVHVPRPPAATRRYGGTQGPTDLGLVRRPPAPCSPTVWALLAAGAVVAAVDSFYPGVLR
jgi:hypothetical protein